MFRQCHFRFMAVIAALVCLTSAMAYGDYICGDANADESVNVADAVWIINYIFAGGYDPCDTDGDGVPDC